jgi:hypothetical protein
MSGWIDAIAKLDLKKIASIGSAVGAAITIVTRLSSGLAQYSKEEKRRREIGKATRLITFIKRVSEAKDAMASQEIQEVLPVLDEELRSTLTSLKTGYSAPPHRDLSAVQRAFLFYSPVGVREWLAHILFYSLSVTTALATLGMFLEQKEKGFSWQETGVDSLALLFWGFIAWAFRAWALRLRSRRIRGTVGQEKIESPPNALRRLSILVWFATAVYALLIVAGVIGYFLDAGSGPSSISLKVLILVSAYGMPVIPFAGLAITSWRARIFSPEPKRAWNWELLVGIRKPFTSGTILSAACRYVFIAFFLGFLFNAGHVVRKDASSLSSYWTGNLREPWIFLIPFFLVVLPFLAAVRWSDLAALISSKRAASTRVSVAPSISAPVDASSTSG